MKRIAVLTSGGDVPGMNAAIRSIVKKGIHEKIEVYGVNQGFAGLVDGDIEKLTTEEVDDIVSKGGTLLHSARYPEFSQEKNVKQAIEQLKKLSIEGLVVIGGDGSYRGALALAQQGYPTISIPGSIDNDVPGTEFSIGFDTAINTVLESIDKIRDTASSHLRTIIIEVMGRNSGNIALWAGVAGGVEEIIIPEKEFSMEDIASQITKRNQNNKKHNIILVAEGVMTGQEFAEELGKYIGSGIRTTNLGHIQRGGAPSARDRVLASVFGFKAVNLLKDGISGKCLGVIGSEIITNDILSIFTEDKDHSQVFLEKLNKEIT